MLSHYGKTYPNIYVMLIGPPAIGKTVSIKSVREYIKASTEIRLGSISVTGASLIIEMDKASYPVYYPEQRFCNSLLLMPHDLQALLSEYDANLVANLTVFFDVEPYTMSRKTDKEVVKIESPQLSILAGTTPSQLHDLLDDSAWDQGFMSRVIMVYSQEEHVKDDIFFSEGEEFKIDLNDDLVHDLHSLFELTGQFRMSDEWRAAVNGWRKTGQEPKPSHPKLKHYCTRREAQLLKLSMISCADRGDELRIEKYDYDRAIKWLLLAEKTMPYVFEEAITADAKMMQEIVHAMGRGEMLQKTLTRMVSKKVSATMVPKILKLMVDTGMIEASRIDGANVFFKVTDSS